MLTDFVLLQPEGATAPGTRCRGSHSGDDRQLPYHNQPRVPGSVHQAKNAVLGTCRLWITRPRNGGPTGSIHRWLPRWQSRRFCASPSNSRFQRRPPPPRTPPNHPNHASPTPAGPPVHSAFRSPAAAQCVHHVPCSLIRAMANRVCGASASGGGGSKASRSSILLRYSASLSLYFASFCVAA